MNERSLEIMRRLLRPATADEIAALVRVRTGHESGCEQLTLADAGLEDEVREILAIIALENQAKPGPVG